MRDALSMLDQVSSFTSEKITINEVHEVNGTLPQIEIKKIILDLFDKNISEVLKKIDAYNNDGKNLAKLIEEIMIFLKNVLLYRNALEYLKENNSNYEIYNIDVDNNYIINCIEIFNEALNVMKKTVNQKIILETTMIKLINIDSKTINVSNTQKEIKTESIEKTKVSISIQNDKKEKSSSEKEIRRLIENEILTKVNDEVKESLKEVKKIRINNALSGFNKKNLLEFKEKLEQIRNLILDPTYNYEASMVLDGKLKAIGNNYLVFVYDTEHISDLFNEKILNIEKMFRDTFDNEYKVISTYLDDWNIIKEQFNNKEKKYKYIEEKIDINNIFSKKNENENKNDIDEMFEEILEYN